MGESVDPQPEMAKGSAKEVSYSNLCPSKQQECNQGHAPGALGRFDCEPTFAAYVDPGMLAHVVSFCKRFIA